MIVQYKVKYNPDPVMNSDQYPLWPLLATMTVYTCTLCAVVEKAVGGE